ncbi:MAG: molecular chaperone TorD family protein [Steroidobacteraceae bacterium]
MRHSPRCSTPTSRNCAAPTVACSRSATKALPCRSASSSRTTIAAGRARRSCASTSISATRSSEQHAWQPDHLSVELEFVHMLCWHESQAADGAAALPFQLAQADFTQRHLAAWTPTLAAQVAARAPGSLYARVTRAIADFIVADDAWQRATLVVEGPAAPG